MGSGDIQGPCPAYGDGGVTSDKHTTSTAKREHVIFLSLKVAKLFF